MTRETALPSELDALWDDFVVAWHSKDGRRIREARAAIEAAARTPGEPGLREAALQTVAGIVNRPGFGDAERLIALRAYLDAALSQPAEAERYGAALIPEGQPCPICGPNGHGLHEDDSYGACATCREYVAHTDDETRLVPFPCAAAILAAQPRQEAPSE
jgi:hypothetical protein